MTKEKDSQAYAYAIGELCFILLPFLVMTIIYAYKSKLPEIFKEPEWTLASSVLYGQSIVKLIQVIAKSKYPDLKHYRVGAVISVLILLGLVPSLIILSLIFTSEVVPNWLVITQIVLFILAVFVFTIVNIFQAEEEEK